MTTGRDQTARLLALVPYLQRHPGARLDETAERFQITERQLRADLNIAYMCGLPGLLPDDMIDVDMEAVDGDGLIYLRNADFLARPLRLTADEASSLSLALTAARDLADRATTEAIDSALAKLHDALGALPTAGTVELASGAPEIRDRVTQAIADGRRLQIAYDGPRRSSRPIVEPARLVVRDGVAYLQAWACERADWRLYRLERITAAELLDQVAQRRTPPDVDASWAERLTAAGEVTLLVRPEATWISDYYPVRGVEARADGLTAVTLGVADPAWLTSLLLRLGPGVVAVEPDSAAADARAQARAALAHYAPDEGCAAGSDDGPDVAR